MESLPFKTDIIFIDYGLHITPNERVKGSPHVEYEKLMQSFKDLALHTFDGIYVVNAHQINREGRKEAEKSEKYTIRDLSMTAGAERSSDVILYLLRLDKYKQENEVRMGVIKNRDGKADDNGRMYFENYEVGLIDNLVDIGAASTEEIDF